VSNGQGSLSTVGLFAGIGGLEKGLLDAGHSAEMLVEILPEAQAVLSAQFPSVDLRSDVTRLRSIPRVQLVAAGFPCQDLSQAGRKRGIGGSQSSLVEHVFRLCGTGRKRPDWLLLENVSYMLRLDRGMAMTHLVDRLEEAGFRWAYRVVDARSFGVPQRRLRVILLASPRHDPREVLFADDSDRPEFDDKIGPVRKRSAYGFYWTEGLRGLGWAQNAVPTIKGGSRIGIPSPPAVWYPNTGAFGLPDIIDVERMQGFPAGWTLPSETFRKKGPRWHLVGNAVCVDVARWIGKRLTRPGEPIGDQVAIGPNEKWPTAAWGDATQRYRVELTPRPFASDIDLKKFLSRPLRPLSLRAGQGFLERALRGNLRFADGFLESLTEYLISMSLDEAV
jgi:DNA (cytosine-5)-methyltransferase 1